MHWGKTHCMVYSSLASSIFVAMQLALIASRRDIRSYWLVIIYLPSSSWKEFLYWVQKRRLCRMELHHHKGTCCKSFMHHKARVVDGNNVRNDDTQSHAWHQQLSLFRWNQSFIQWIKKCDEAFCIVWADSWYVAKDTIIGDGSTRGDNGAHLIWHCNTGPLPSDVPSASSNFREVKAGFTHINEYAICPFNFKLHYSPRKSKFIRQIIPVVLCVPVWYGKALQHCNKSLLAHTGFFGVSLKSNSVHVLPSNMVASGLN